MTRRLAKAASCKNEPSNRGVARESQALQRQRPLRADCHDGRAAKVNAHGFCLPALELLSAPALGARRALFESRRVRGDLVRFLTRRSTETHRETRALPPFISLNTSSLVAMLVSPGVVIASAP